MKHLRSFVLLMAVASSATLLLAEEGMWMPQQIPQLGAKLKALGFKGDPKSFADLTGQPPRDIGQFARDYAAAFSG